MNTEREQDAIPTTFTDWREARRFRAWALHEDGWRQVRIAEALGVSEGAVSQWFAAVREAGVPALLSDPGKRGPPPKLSEDDLRQLAEYLSRGAEAYEFRGAVWTRARVGKVIEKEFGVTFSARHVGRLLKQIGWTRQKPVERADQRNEADVAQWRAETFPRLKKKPQKKDEPWSS